MTELTMEWEAVGEKVGGSVRWKDVPGLGSWAKINSQKNNQVDN